ncbi:AAA family ATPase [Mangrovicella endophytica]|uniref:bifunctional aminoglycoside phosphotransferase/ATP-binding protein n=1 Tax=Mangrovicella endophytica TaxID=2066697 RepID=UPI000C9E3792|nr:bifunctional aminoglycoside phosphotransferase/ATP-binding protein [Mangrovicella endophytica]
MAELQDEVIRWLSETALADHEESVETIETHISRIVLSGQRAFKMKRAITLPYADFSTPERRLAACKKEVALNRRTAPELYLGTRLITREAGGTFTFDGPGELVEAAVEMRRFDQSCLLDHMAEAGMLTPSLMTQVAGVIADFHRSVPPVHAGSGAANIAAVMDINRAGFATSHVFAADEVAALDSSFRAALRSHTGLLDRREAAGRVRHCHGDLHLRNICLLDGIPRLFDCIEFNDALATIDVLYDLAFLLMDLWHRKCPTLASLVANRYLDIADEEDGFALLPFFMALRAAVRAHVIATQCQAMRTEAPPEERQRLVAEARAYFALAGEILRPVPPRLVAIGGFSGSGKTTVADALAPHLGAPPGARVLESDRIRKAMHGVSAETRLPDAAYSATISASVYRTIAERIGSILESGGSVVTDAVFDRTSDRVRVQQAAIARGVRFLGVWLETDPDVLRQRVRGRKGGPSDATLDVLSRQLAGTLTELTWHRIDAGRDLQAVVDEVGNLVEADPPLDRTSPGA